jgi:hypothetical protein
MYIRPIIGPHPWDQIMHINTFTRTTVVVRLASFGAAEIAFEAIWIDANRSNEARRTSRGR